MALDGGTPRLRHRPTVGCLLKTVFGCRLGAAARPTADKLFLTYLAAHA